jgi:hypothetical protein
MFNDVDTAELMKIFEKMDFDKDGHLSNLDLAISLSEEVFNSEIPAFRDYKCYDDYLIDLPTKIEMHRIGDLFPLTDYSASVMLYHGVKDKSSAFSLKEQLTELKNFEENITKWTMAER